MASKSAYECKGCSRRFDDSGKHLTNARKCLNKYSPDEKLKIFEDQLRILNKKISCESCNKSFDDTSILKHLSSKELCKRYYKTDEKKRENLDLLKEVVTTGRNSKRRLIYAIDKLTQTSQDAIPFVININPDAIAGTYVLIFKDSLKLITYVYDGNFKTREMNSLHK